MQRVNAVKWDRLIHDYRMRNPVLPGIPARQADGLRDPRSASRIT